jgi:hypothetical protein
MEDSLFLVLKQIEPSTVELTKADYEDRMGIKPSWKASKKIKDVGQPVVENPEVEAEASVRVTRGEAIKTLRARGFEYADLKSKKLSELKELI